MTSPSIHWNKGGGADIKGEDKAQNVLSQDTTIKYCLHCDWHTRGSDGYTKQERSREAIDHHVETGHTIDSIR